MAEVGCAGLLVEDTFCGPLPVLPPEGALHLLPDMPVKAGGCAANVAIDLAKQGVSADVVGCVGEDSAAEVLYRSFKSHGVGTAGIVRTGEYPTSKTIILLIEGQDRRYLHVTGANGAFSLTHISQDWLASLKVFYLGGLFGLPGIDFKHLATLLEFCRAQKIVTVVDVIAPSGTRDMKRLQPLLSLIDVFVPNEDEARVFTGLTDRFDQLRALRSAGANTVIVTCGSEGSVASDGQKIFRCGAYQMQTLDPSGSGDAFTSGVIRSLLMGWDLPRTLRYASALGASATRSAGTTEAVFSAAEAEAFLETHPLTVAERT